MTGLAALSSSFIVIGMKNSDAPPRRGRPRSFDRHQALCAALRVFRERGYEGTSIADLQKAVGVPSPPSLYAAFGSKEELFKEAVGLYTDHIREVALKAVGDAPTTKGKLLAMLRSTVQWTTEPGEPRGCLLVNGAIACSPSNESVQSFLRDLRQQNRALVTKFLKAGVASGDLPPGTDVAAMAAFYSTFMHGLTIQARDGASRASMLAAVECAMAAWDSLVARR